MSRRVRVAVLGTQHPHVFPRIELLRARADVDLLGFVEEDDDTARRLADRTGQRRIPRDELPAIDIAVVEGLDRDVPALARAGVRAGARGVLLEKPGAARPEALFELARELEEAGIEVEIGYELHYSDAVTWCRELLDGGVLGQVTTSRFHGGCPSGAGAELWQSLPDDLGGLVFTEGSHVLEIVYDLFGLPDQVSASVRRLPKQQPTTALVFKPDLFSDPQPDVELSVGELVHEDVATVILEYPTQSVSVDLTAWEPTTWCTQWWIEVYGTNGSLIAVPEPAELRLHLRAARGNWPAGATVRRAATDPARPGLQRTYARQLDSLVKRVSGSPTQTHCGLKHAVGVMRLLDTIYRSARSRAWVHVSREPS